MTTGKKFKKQVRARMGETGETYTQAGKALEEQRADADADDDRIFIDWVESTIEDAGREGPLVFPLVKGDRVHRMTIVDTKGRKVVLTNVVCTRGLEQPPPPIEGEGITTEELKLEFFEDQE